VLYALLHEVKKKEERLFGGLSRTSVCPLRLFM